MSDFLAALGLAIVIEGLAYAAFPEQMKKWLTLFNTLPVPRIRAAALVFAAVGLAILWVARG